MPILIVDKKRFLWYIINITKQQTIKKGLMMKLAEYKNGEIKEVRIITNLKNLENCDLVLMERGDSLKKDLKKTACCFGNKNLYSVKRIKEALEEAAIKKAKKQNFVAWCCVCGEYEVVEGTIYCADCTMKL